MLVDLGGDEVVRQRRQVFGKLAQSGQPAHHLRVFPNPEHL